MFSRILQKVILIDRSTVIAIQSFGALLGCIVTPFTISKLGTKLTVLVLNNTVLALASLIYVTANSNCSAFLLFPGRLLSGVYIGITSVSLPIMIQELAPKNIKVAFL